jgi:hypothetical protein
MQNIEKFMPAMQRQIVRDSEEFAGELRRLNEEIEAIPDRYQAEIVYAHFFYARCDWFVLSWDRENEIIFCYVILNGDVEMSELGDVWLPDLVNDGRIELDFYWEKTTLARAKYDKYLDYFPAPGKPQAGIPDGETVPEAVDSPDKDLIYNEKTGNIECRCGHPAVKIGGGYVCGTITAYPCEYVRETKDR